MFLHFLNQGIICNFLMYNFLDFSKIFWNFFHPKLHPFPGPDGSLQWDILQNEFLFTVVLIDSLANFKFHL